MEKKGILDHTIVQGVFVGVARSGKDSLMKRLLGKKVSKNLMSPSTGVAENAVQVKVSEQTATIATNVEESCWTEMDYDDEAIKLMSISINNEIQNYPGYQLKEGILIESSLFLQRKDSEDEMMGDLSISVDRSITSDNTTVDESDQLLQGQTRALTCPSKVLSFVPPLDILKRALQNKGLEALRQHFQKTWSLYLTNTGGQMEFQEVLSLLVSGPAIFFFTFRLDQDLNEHYSVEYQLSTGMKSTLYKATSTTIEGILQTLASISAMGIFIYQGLQKRKAPLRPKIFFVGTHKDKLNPSSAANHIASIDRQLQEIIISTSHYEHLVEFASPSQLIFTVNNLSESDSDFQYLRSAVERVVMRDKFQMTSPAHWLVFSLALRKLDSHVISYDLCFEIAK